MHILPIKYIDFKKYIVRFMYNKLHIITKALYIKITDSYKNL